LQPSAFAPDGIIEALEDPSRRFLVSVQWHPEDLTDRPEHLAIFEGLVGAAKNISPPRHQEHQGTPRMQD
jgi:putative glutamine amidotransferase